MVDNALKLSASAERRCVVLSMTAVDEQTLAFGVRDFGPGIAPALRRHVFGLFFRGGSELTRESQGAGIGLALVPSWRGACTATSSCARSSRASNSGC